MRLGSRLRRSDAGPRLRRVDAGPRLRLPALAGVAVLLAVLLVAWASPARASAAPATLTLQTVPRLDGARIAFDGRTYVTGPTGFVSISTSSGTHEIGAARPASMPAAIFVRFGRWLDGGVARRRRVTLHAGTNHEQVGFVLARPVSLSVGDPSGGDIPLTSISRIELTGSRGQRVVFEPPQARARFDVNYLVRKPGGLVSLPLRYRLQAVIMHGANVVHEGDQSFFVRKGEDWRIQALVFPLRIEVRDALFGFGIGHTVRLVFPDGTTRKVTLDGDNRAVVAGLPRGLYRLVPEGPGFGLSSPTALSRPQLADLLIFSWLDIIAVVGFAALFIVGLPILGGRLVRRAGSRLPAWRSTSRDEAKAQPGGASGAQPTTEVRINPDTKAISAGPAASEGAGALDHQKTAPGQRFQGWKR